MCAKSRWPPLAFRPNELYGFCGRKATLNYALGIGHSLSLICQPADIRGHEALHHHHDLPCIYSVAGELCKLARVTGPEFPPPLLSSPTLPASDWPVPRGAV